MRILVGVGMLQLSVTQYVNETLSGVHLSAASNCHPITESHTS
jgi:hypothetical protein